MQPPYIKGSSRILKPQALLNTEINPIVKPKCSKNVQNPLLLNRDLSCSLEPGALVTTIIVMYPNIRFNNSAIIPRNYTTIHIFLNTIEPKIKRIVPMGDQTQFLPTEKI